MTKAKTEAETETEIQKTCTWVIVRACGGACLHARLCMPDYGCPANIKVKQ